MEVQVFNTEGQQVNTVELNNDVFGVEPNDHAIYLAVKQFMANKRQGTHKAKERAEISGSTKKIKKQKGTGTARAGSIKSPLFRGGGRVFGPRPKNYSFKLNKKLKKLAKNSALTYKAKEEKIIAIEDLVFENPKTKRINQIRENLKINDKKTIIILLNQNNNVYLSSRNLQDIKVITISELNTYEILNADFLLFEEKALAKINQQEEVKTQTVEEVAQ